MVRRNAMPVGLDFLLLNVWVGNYDDRPTRRSRRCAFRGRRISESATLRTHWVLVVMDEFTRRIVGFGVHGGIVDGIALCRMFNRAICGQSLPKYLSSDHDPLCRFRWRGS